MTAQSDEMLPRARLQWMTQGTQTFLAALERIDDAGLSKPSALPGWSRKHVIAHVAANAEALSRLVSWARTGVESRMYSSPEQRDSDIQTGAERPPAELRAWLTSSAGRLAVDLKELNGEQWANPVVTAQGRTVAPTEVPWMRAREVMVHAVDLDAQTSFADLPEGFLVALLDDVAAKRSAGPPGPALLLLATDHEKSWHVSGVGASVTVEATLAEVAAWLTGRTEAVGTKPNSQPVPRLGAWL